MAGLPMSDELQISVFSVSGRIDVYVSGQVDVQPRRSTENTNEKKTQSTNGKSDDDERKTRLELERLVVSELNKRAQEIAASIESEMRRVLPGTTVQAEVSFRKGSLLLEGSVVLLSWAGGLVLEAARAEISEVLRVAFRRTITNALNNLSAAPEIGAIEMAVTETRRPRASPSPTPRESGALLSHGGQTWIPVLLLFLTVLVLILIADRFFVISPRPTVPLPQPAATAAPGPTRNP
jgi:hypothetical protein